MTVRAISLDLDDTLWPIGPAIGRAEQALAAWLAAHAPAVAAAFPPPTMGTLRAEAFARAAAAGKTHDLRWVRRTQISIAFERAGEPQDGAAGAYQAFEHARQSVEPWPDVAPALARLAARYPIAAVTNGFADLQRIGLGRYFTFAITAGEHGAAKPDAGIFHAACRALGVEPAHVLHVGDDPELDVAAARRAGLQSAWMNRHGAAWPGEQPAGPVYASMEHLADSLENTGR